MNSTEKVVFNVINVFLMSKKVIYFFIYHTAATHCIISDVDLKGKYRVEYDIMTLFVWLTHFHLFISMINP